MLFRYDSNITTGTKYGWTSVKTGPAASGTDYILSWPEKTVEIEHTPAWPHCKEYHGPEMGPNYHPAYLVIKDKKKAQKLRDTGEFPDISQSGSYMFVSEAFKQAVEQLDSMEHQFCLSKVVDRDGEILTRQPMYWMHLRRFLDVEDIGAEFQFLEYIPGNPWKYDLKTREAHIPGVRERRPITGDNMSQKSNEARRVATIQSSPALREKIETLPFWRFHICDSALYMNQETIEALWAAGITGLKEVSKKIPKREETVSHV